jgi:hypothetical protein
MKLEKGKEMEEEAIEEKRMGVGDVKEWNWTGIKWMEGEEGLN